MTARSGKEVKNSTDKISSVRTGIHSSFTKEKPVKAATQRTEGDEKLAEKVTSSKIDLGAGKNPVDGCVTVDQYSHNNPDFEFNLEQDEWPLPSNQFSEIYCNHCLEHLDNWKNALKEIYRIAEDGATVIIRVPHSSYSVLHPDHKTHFNYSSLEEFCDPDTQQYIGGVQFKMLDKKLYWRDYKARKRYEVVDDYIFNSIGKVVDSLVNIDSVTPFALRFCFWFSGFEEVYWKLEVVK